MNISSLIDTVDMMDTAQDDILTKAKCILYDLVEGHFFTPAIETDKDRERIAYTYSQYRTKALILEDYLLKLESLMEHVAADLQALHREAQQNSPTGRKAAFLALVDELEPEAIETLYMAAKLLYQ